MKINNFGNISPLFLASIFLAQQDCDYDSVEIRSGENDADTLHGTFCGTDLPETITSDSNGMRITFNTDNNIQKSGFSAHFFIGNSVETDSHFVCRNFKDLLACLITIMSVNMYDHYI